MPAKSDKLFRPLPVAHTGKQQRDTAGAGPVPLAALTGLGVVFGDLGTSPLYTMQTVMGSVRASSPAETALGVLSLIFWTLLVTISLKYCFFVMRADNHGRAASWRSCRWWA